MKSVWKIKHPILLTLFCLFFVFPIFLLGSLAVNGYHTFMPTFNSLLKEGNQLIESIDENTFNKREDTQIYDCNGSLISEINVTNYQYAELKDISPYLIRGYVAVEDKNFYEHHGIDLKAIVRVAAALVVNRGEITQGGSTITQQVLKNNLITDKSTVERKIMEILIAGKLEDRLTKDEIMEAYCNTNYYANNCFGVETASLYYYGKHASDLTLSEAATLIGISNLPARYDPKAHPEAALTKRNFVLNEMLNEKVITVPEYMMARREVPTYVFQKEARTEENYLTSYAIHCATEELMEQQGFSFQYMFETAEEYEEYHNAYSDLYTEISSDIRLGGYKIYTSLNPVYQEKLQSYLDQALSPFQERGEDGFYELQGAAVTVDNRTGYVVAIVGGREGKGEFNRGYQAIRQPGSAIKPLIVYTPAFETGDYYPSKVMVDEPIKNGPKNAYSGYKGRMNLYEALGRSTNTIAYDIMLHIGANYGASYLAEMEFSHMSYQDQNNGSMALGGFTYGVSVDEMAKGYSTLACQGVYNKNTCIKKIEYRHSGVIYEPENEQKAVFIPDTAYMTTDMMKGVLTSSYGTGRSRNLSNAIAAAKTGTTNGQKDVWFCGSTVYYSTAVWVGYDTPRESHNLSGTKYPGKVWQDFMTYLHQDLPVVDFERPDTIVERPVDANGDPASWGFFRKGIFSSIIEEKEEAERKAREEKERAERESKRKETIDAMIVSLSKKTLHSYDQIPELETEYDLILSQIGKFEEDTNKKAYLEKLDLVMDSLYRSGDIKYEPGTVFFIDSEADTKTRSVLNSFIEEKRVITETKKEIIQKLEQLKSVLAISDENVMQVSDDLRDVRSMIEAAAESMDVSEFLNQFSNEKERIEELLVSYLLSHPNLDPLDFLDSESIDVPSLFPEKEPEELPPEPVDPKPTPSPAPSEPEKVIQAKQMIDFLKTIYPGDERAAEYIQNAESSVQACSGMAEYPYILQAFNTEVSRLLGG